MKQTWQRGDYLIDTDRARLNVELIHDFLANQSYWAIGRSREQVQRAIENSLCFGLYRTNTDPSEQIGFARVVTDYATFAWLADVFVTGEHRGQGLAKWLMDVIVSHPQLQGFRRWLLATRDAHELYRRYGFSELNDPARWMERFEEKSLSTD